MSIFKTYFDIIFTLGVYKSIMIVIRHQGKSIRGKRRDFIKDWLSYESPIICYKPIFSKIESRFREGFFINTWELIIIFSQTYLN